MQAFIQRRLPAFLVLFFAAALGLTACTSSSPPGTVADQNHYVITATVVATSSDWVRVKDVNVEETSGDAVTWFTGKYSGVGVDHYTIHSSSHQQPAGVVKNTNGRRVQLKQLPVGSRIHVEGYIGVEITNYPQNGAPKLHAIAAFSIICQLS
jgi:hypothetical protein